MPNKPHVGHNGHRDHPIGAERVRSGFDRRRNWGDSIENIYRRIDHRLSELVQEGARHGQESVERVIETGRRRPALWVVASFLSGLLLGFLVSRQTNE